MSDAARGLPLRPPRSGADVAITMRRRQKAGQWNRVVGWLLIPVLLVATGTYHLSESGDVVRDVANVLQVVLIFATLLHAFLSFYVFGYVRPQRSLRVFHIYFGYLTFALVIVSQSTITGPRAFHISTTVLMYLAIAAHTVIGVRYQVIRRRAQRLTPDLIPADSR